MVRVFFFLLTFFTGVVAAAAAGQANPTPAPPSTTPPPIVYLVSADASSTVNSQSTAISSVYASASKVINAFNMSAIRLNSTFDPKAPQVLCINADGRSAVRPQDLLLVFSLGLADQSINKYLGGDTEKVELSFTRIICPTSAQGLTTFGASAGNVSNYWGPTSAGSYSHFYWANPVSGIASIAALLTSPWVNKYRLWLTVPGTFLDSFKNEQSALDGTIYCATADAMLEMLRDGGLVTLEEHDGQLFAYRRDTANNEKLRVRGVNRCKQQQPQWPRMQDEVVTKIQ